MPEKVSALVLDADAPQRSVLVEQLDLCNYTVGTADNFADALRKLRSKHNTSEPYHLLLADLAFVTPPRYPFNYKITRMPCRSSWTPTTT